MIPLKRDGSDGQSDVSTGRVRDGRCPRSRWSDRRGSTAIRGRLHELTHPIRNTVFNKRVYLNIRSRHPSILSLPFRTMLPIQGLSSRGTWCKKIINLWDAVVSDATALKYIEPIVIYTRDIARCLGQKNFERYERIFSRYGLSLVRSLRAELDNFRSLQRNS